MVWAKMKFPFEKRVKLAQSLWLISWLTTLGGVLTFCFGCILKTELNKRAEGSGLSKLLAIDVSKHLISDISEEISQVMDNTEIHVVPNTLILAGLASIVINWFAGRICQDALDAARFPRWKTFLKPYYCCSIFFTTLMLLGVILSYTMKGTLEGALKIGLKNGIRFYKDTDTPGRCFQKQTIDHLQMEFQCCGNNDYKDWFEVQWISNRYLDYSSKEVKDRVKSNVDGRYLVDGVPFSCCNPSSPRPCIQYKLTNNSAHYNYEHQTEELNIFIRGCRVALLGYYMSLMNSFGAIVLCVFLLQGAVLACLRYLQTSMEAVLGQENTEIETEGYLLERSVKETIMEYLDPLLKLMLINQVQDGQAKAEAGAAGTSAS